MANDSHNHNIDPMLTTSDVARLLNVHINTVRRWSNQGVIKTYRIGSRGDRRFRSEDVSTFLAEQHNNGGENGGKNGGKEVGEYGEGVSG
jgi:excisionase family DNA binding protein